MEFRQLNCQLLFPSYLAPCGRARMWAQKTIQVTAPKRGCHLITKAVVKGCPEIASIRVGLANVFLQHTSASLSINENADPTVRTDMENALNHIVPEDWHEGPEAFFEHTLEGPDDMTGHVKSSLMGVSLNIPITNGRLNLGTWQGIYLNEHRNAGGWGGGHRRHIVITVQGQPMESHSPAQGGGEKKKPKK